MSFGRVLRGLLLTSGTVVLVAGTLAVLLNQGRRKRRVIIRVPQGVSPGPAPMPGLPRPDYFEISRTKSEVGFVFWILRGHGAFKCYELFDTWQEAVDEAERRSKIALVS